jgi:hypothetical protein
MRRRAKVDANQSLIVSALRNAGAFVQPLHMVGKGVPDLLAIRRGVVYLLEVKDGTKPASARKLTPDESAWHAAAYSHGYTVAVVDGIESALAAVGLGVKKI